jgi:hypothetical protein
MTETLNELIEKVRGWKKSGPIKGTDYFLKMKEYGRFGKWIKDKHGTIFDEYRLEKIMHGLIPENSLEPLHLVEDNQGVPVGYIIKKVDGRGLNYSLIIPDKAKEELKRSLAILNQHGYVHGDIRDKNILLDKNGHITLIDPMYRGPNRHGIENDRIWGNFWLNVIPSYSELKTGGLKTGFKAIFTRLLYTAGFMEAYAKLKTEQYK